MQVKIKLLLIPNKLFQLPFLKTEAVAQMAEHREKVLKLTRTNSNILQSLKDLFENYSGQLVLTSNGYSGGRWFDSTLLRKLWSIVAYFYLVQQQNYLVIKLCFMNTLLKVSLRQKAVFIPETVLINKYDSLQAHTSLLAANLANLGFGVSEQLLNALNNTTPGFQFEVLEMLRDVTGVNKNWTPLVKGWNVPTGESVTDHIITFFANIFKSKGTTLPCGHIIPDNTFPLQRYTGCPFCKKPFEFGKIEHYKQGSEQKVLDLWTRKEAADFLKDLLTSKTALDATQIDSLKILLAEFPLPDVSIAMKETLMAVIDIFVSQGQPEKAQAFFTSPTDVLRYLWYKHTGFLQIIEPATIIKRKVKNSHFAWQVTANGATNKLQAKAALKLKYNRKDCLMVEQPDHRHQQDVRNDAS
jgi:hypothetical protein